MEELVKLSPMVMIWLNTEQEREERRRSVPMQEGEAESLISAGNSSQSRSRSWRGEVGMKVKV